MPNTHRAQNCSTQYPFDIFTLRRTPIACSCGSALLRKNHKGVPPLRKHKNLGGAATSENIPQTYGKTRVPDQNTAGDESEFTNVGGAFVAATAPYVPIIKVSNMFSPPFTLAEELSDDEN